MHIDQIVVLSNKTPNFSSVRISLIVLCKAIFQFLPKGNDMNLFKDIRLYLLKFVQFKNIIVCV